MAAILVTLAIRLFGRRHFLHIWLTLGIVWVYVWLTGAGAPVVRAAIMLTFLLGAELLGRQRSGVIALVLAAAIMVGVDPRVLRDASFQLSFAAMAGLVFIVPALGAPGASALARIPEGRVRALLLTLGAGFGVSLAAVIMTWPLTAYYFGLVSWVGPVTTFLAMPAMPAIIVTSMAAAAAGLVLMPVGQVVGWLAWLSLSYLMTVVKAFGAVHGISFGVETVPGSLVASYYAALALLFWSYSRRRDLSSLGERVAAAVSAVPARWLLVPLSLVALLAWLTFATMPDKNLHVSFLDVGQGDAILIEKGSRQILVDGGPNPRSVIAEMSKRMAFWDRTIDMVVLTHPDADHLGGLVEVLKRYRVGAVLSTNLTDDSPLFRQWQAGVDSMPGRLRVATAGQRITLGDDVSVTVLGPGPSTARGRGDASNDLSIVLQVSTGKVSFLLTGDLPLDGETELIMQRASLGSTVLKVAHHGSVTSTSDAFLSAVGPRVAVISVGKDNTYGHPNKDVMARLEGSLGAGSIYRTDEQGTIEFITDGKRLWVRTGR